MIVKNEAESLADCLHSVKDIADQMVIVDTGSSDQTLSIANKFGAEVYNFKWQNHFAKARNHSLQYANGDWILWMDADERLMPESQENLKKLLQNENKPVAYKVQIQNLQKDQKTVIISDAHRLFTNHQGVHFSGRIHEQISPSIKKLDGEIRNSGVNIFHTGYSFTGDREAKKQSRNKKLLTKMVEEEPENAYAHYTLGQFYGMNGQQEKAIHHYKKAYQLDTLPPNMTASLLNVLSEELFKQNKLPGAENYIEKSIKITEKQVAAFYLKYKLARARQETDSAIQNLKTILKNGRLIQKSGKNISTDVLIEADKIQNVIGELYASKEDFTQAKIYFNKALQKNNKNKPVRKNLIRLANQTGDWKELKNILQNCSIWDEVDLDFLQKQGKLLIKKGKYKIALTFYDQILNIDADNILAMKRKAGLFAKTGQEQKAKEMVMKLQELK
ncbi:MAG: glycosyltransferase [Candidatus Marinimicrobia bacterium]|nr:glycosyltransferase [Candidatus Neomarinimicrobiota bacterium]